MSGLTTEEQLRIDASDTLRAFNQRPITKTKAMPVWYGTTPTFWGIVSAIVQGSAMPRQRWGMPPGSQKYKPTSGGGRRHGARECARRVRQMQKAAAR